MIRQFIPWRNLRIVFHDLPILMGTQSQFYGRFPSVNNLIEPIWRPPFGRNPIYRYDKGQGDHLASHMKRIRIII